MGLVSSCIWFAFCSMLSFFSSQGQFLHVLLAYVIRVTAGELKDFTEWRREFCRIYIWNSADQSNLPVPSLLTALKAFQVKIKKKTFFHFTFDSTGHSYTYDYTVFIDLFNETVHRLFSAICNDLIWMPITHRSFCSAGGQWKIHDCNNLQVWWLSKEVMIGREDDW